MKSEKNIPYKSTGVKWVSKHKIFSQDDASASKGGIISATQNCRSWGNSTAKSSKMELTPHTSFCTERTLMRL